MNWDAIGAIGEIIGAIAVVITLGYLALQIRQQNTSQNLSAKETILEGFNRANEHLASDPELAVLYIRGLENPEQLTNAEATQFSWLLRLFMNQWLKVYGLYQSGTLPESEWQNYASQAAWTLNKPGGKLWVECHGNSFTEYIEAIRKVEYDDLVIDFTMGRSWNEY